MDPVHTVDDAVPTIDNRLPPFAADLSGDGLTATREIRRREAQSGRRRTPIIALTANAMDHQVAEYRAAGMNSVVAKPIQVAQLFDAIDAVLQDELAAEAV